MFLIVFVTLMLSIASLFVQAASLQTAQMYRLQNAFMQSMVTWHTAAVNLIHVNPPVWTGVGCSVTPYYVAGVTPGISSIMPALGALPPPCPMTLTNDGKFLVSAYNIKAYSYYTVAFQNTVSPFYKYVVTFVYSTNAAGYINLPDAGTAISPPSTVGYSLKDLNGQLMRAAPSNLFFGTVITSAGTQYISVPSIAGGGSYPLPSWIPSGAIAMISLAT